MNILHRFSIIFITIFSSICFTNNVFVIKGNEIHSKGGVENPSGPLWILKPDETPIRALNYKESALILYLNKPDATFNVIMKKLDGSSQFLAKGWSGLQDIAYIGDTFYMITPTGKLSKKSLANPALLKVDAIRPNLPQDSFANVKRMIAVGKHLIVLKKNGTLLDASVDGDGDVSQIQPYAGSRFTDAQMTSVDDKNFLILEKGNLFQGNSETNNIVNIGAFNNGMPILDGKVFAKFESLFFLKDGELQILFNGKDIALRYFDFDSDTLFIVFHSAKLDNEIRTALTSGQSESYFKNKKVSAIFVNNIVNHWWQTFETFQILPMLKEISKNYQHINLYGSSMGGFGALVFSNELNPERVIAFAPQVILEKFSSFRKIQAELGFDTLFTMGLGLSTKPEYFVFYANGYDHDRKAVEEDLERIRAAKGVQNFHAYPLPLKVHSILPVMLKLGYLKPINEAAINGDYKKLDELLKKDGEAWQNFSTYVP